MYIIPFPFQSTQLSQSDHITEIEVSQSAMPVKELISEVAGDKGDGCACLVGVESRGEWAGEERFS
jgi:hypothetical protein